MSSEERPRLAVGHVSLEVDDVEHACPFLMCHGMRDVFRDESFGVPELRGGTHLVVTASREAVRPGSAAPFDPMVDDIDAAHDDVTNADVRATTIERGRIHDTFHIDGPGGCRFAVISSHAAERVV